MSHSFDFLIENNGSSLQEHQSLLAQQEEMRILLNLATKIQNMLLKTAVPVVDGGALNGC